MTRIRVTRDGRIEISGFLWSLEVLEDLLAKIKSGEALGFDLVEAYPGVLEICPVEKRTT